MMPSVIAFALCTLLSLPAHAGWGKKEDMPVYLESSVERIYVKADGSREEEGETTIVVQKEKGIDSIKILRIPYDPNLGKYTIVAAETINNGVAVPVPPSSIEDKAVASGGDGLTNRNMITVAFPALAVGSKIHYKMKRAFIAPYVPGLFHMRVGLATEFYTEKDVTEIRSEIPLVIRHKGASDIIGVEESKEGNLHKYTISLLRPSFRVPIGEPQAAIKDDTMPRIEIGAVGKGWGEVAKHFSPKVEEILTSPLHPEFEAIVAEAAKAPNNVEKARIAMAKLIEKVKYLGDWRTERGYFLPKSFAEVAQSKQGDCKDFSGVTVAMLRKLGMKAHVAWVHRGAENRLVGLLSNSNRAFDPLLPGADHFNHAIVAAEIDGATYWLDPTNPMAHVGPPFSDIADRVALVLKPESIELSRIPKAGTGFHVISTSYMAFRPSGRADVLNRIQAQGSMVTEMARSLSEIKDPKQQERAKFALFSLAPPPGDISNPGVVSEIEPETKAKTGLGEASEQFVYVLEAKGTKTSLGHSFIVPSHPAANLIEMTGGGRVTGVNLGERGGLTRKYLLANFQLQGDLPKNCEIANPWFRISRKFERQPAGLVLTDDLVNMADEISIADVNSRRFEEFRKKFDACFEESALVFKWKLPDPSAPGHAPFPNPLLKNKKDLVKRAFKIYDFTSQDYFRYVYLRMLFWERLQAEAKTKPEVAQALGGISAAVKRQAFIVADEYEPIGSAEADQLGKLVETYDPEANFVLSRKANEAIKQGNFKGAIAIADSLIEKDPKASIGYRFKFSTWLSMREPEAIQNARYNQIIEKGEELLKDPDVACAPCLLDILRKSYTALGKQDEVDKLYEREIELNPKSAWVRLNFAGRLNRQEKYEEAAMQARKAIEIAPVGMAHVNLSHALAGLAVKEIVKDPVSSKAISLCEEALQNFARDRPCLRVLAWAYENTYRIKQDEQLLGLAHQMLDAEKQFEAEERKHPVFVAEVARSEVYWKPAPHDPGGKFRAPVPHDAKTGRVTRAEAPAVSPNASPAAKTPEPNRAPASVTPVPEATVAPLPAPAQVPTQAAIPTYGPPVPVAAP